MNNLVNHVQLIGNLGQDVDLKTVGERESKLARVSLATNEYLKDANGEKTTRTEWHTVVGWGKVAENMKVFGKKGKKVCVTGKLVHRSFKDQSGNDRFTTEVVVREFMMLN